MKLFNNKGSFKEEITKDLVVSLFFASTFIFIVFSVFESEINLAFGILDMITIHESSVEDKDISFNIEKNRLESYPYYGTKYAKVKIDSINVNLDLYHGDTMELLRNSLGHYAGSFFPGEGGRILIAGHNNVGILRELPNIEIGDEIVIEATYGTFTYKVDKTEVMTADELNKMEFTRDKEELVIYTCYPMTIGHPKTRYVVYAGRVS